MFKRLQDANLKLKPSKCIFFQKSVSFLGHIVSETGIGTDPNKVETVRTWPTPSNSKQVRSFLGLASYYRRFIKGFANIARPLHKACEKNQKFKWTLECQTSFDLLKQALTSASVLAYPTTKTGFILDTDASDKAVGAVLSQIQDNQEKVIAYMSKAISKQEQSNCITRKELLAVVVALRTFHSYLYGQEVLLRTDNAAVSWLRSLRCPTGQVARWLQELNTYNLNVEHRAGRSHNNADALSRRPCKSCSRQQQRNVAENLEESLGQTDDGDSDIETMVRQRAVTRQQAKKEEHRELTDNQMLLNLGGK